MSEPHGKWEPLSPEEAAKLLTGLPVPWWIAGGWAIDLFARRTTRDHGDTDVLVLRRDQAAVREHLAGWDLHRTGPDGLRPWRPGEHLEAGANSIWCRRNQDAPWSLEILLMDSEGDEWVYRRAPGVRGPLADLAHRTPAGLPFLAPEIQLLFKALAGRGPKDEEDFALALPLLGETARSWLADAISREFPQGHDWIRRLREALPERHPPVAIQQIGPDRLADYASVSIAYEAVSRMVPEEEAGPDGSLVLRAEPLAAPYWKDYDAYPDGGPTAWPERFDTANWGFFLALEGERAVGAAAVALRSPGLHMLEGRSDLSVLWDLRVAPDRRRGGIGTALFEQARDWSRRQGCTTFKIETQDVNVAACRFYTARGCRLRRAIPKAYAGSPEIARETMLLWYLHL
jgi:GNAT superfamily N-acetyltransferase